MRGLWTWMRERRGDGRPWRALALLLGVLGLVAPTESRATPETRLTVVTSSPSSWVARGYADYTVSPSDDWVFEPSRNLDNGVGFRITGPPLPGTTVALWFLDFAAPFEAELAPGFYPDFQRFPFQDPDRPGLKFGSTGRLSNTASGFFEILEVSYGPGGEVLSFAADFTHFGQTNPNNFAVVELRYNAIPEPGTALLLGLGVARLACARRRAREGRADVGKSP